MSREFRPTSGMVDAASKVFVAMACLELIKPIVLSYQRQILGQGQWHIRPDMQVVLKRRTACEPLETLVLDPSKAYMLSDGDFKAYCLECEAARVRADLHSVL